MRERRVVVTASARTRPSAASGASSVWLSIIMSKRPAIRSVTAAGVPRYVTTVKSTLPRLFSSSPDRCEAAPIPVVPKVASPLRCRSQASSEGMSVAGTLGWMQTRKLWSPTSASR